MRQEKKSALPAGTEQSAYNTSGEDVDYNTSTHVHADKSRYARGTYSDILDQMTDDAGYFDEPLECPTCGGQPEFIDSSASDQPVECAECEAVATLETWAYETRARRDAHVLDLGSHIGEQLQEVR